MTKTTTVVTKVKRRRTRTRRRRARVNVTQVRVPRRSRATRTLAHPLEQAVFADIGQSPAFTGIPDGKSLKSVVITHRQTVTLKPFVVSGASQGDLVMAFVPSPMGGVAVASGATGPFTTMSADPDSGHSSTTSLFKGISKNEAEYGVIPFKEWTSMPNVFNQDTSFLAVQNYRVVVQKAILYYTGPLLSSSGSAAVGRQVVVADGTVPTGTIKLKWKDYMHNPKEKDIPALVMSGPAPASYSAVAGITGSSVFSVDALRRGIKVMNAPYDYEYQPWRDQLIPVTNDHQANWYTIMHLTGNQSYTEWWTGPSPGVGFAPTTFVALAGLPPDASLVAHVETVVEYSVATDSPMQHLATASPPEAPAVLRRVTNATRDLPSAIKEEESWITAAAKWYGRTWWNVYSGLTGGLTKAVTGYNIWEEPADAIAGVTRKVARAITGAPAVPAITYR